MRLRQQAQGRDGLPQDAHRRPVHAEAVATGNGVFFRDPSMNLLALSGTAGNAAVARLFQEAHGLRVATPERLGATTVPRLQRQVTTGGPGGRGDCFDLLRAIIELLNELARRINDALDDQHDLFRFHRKTNNPHPDGHGSWDGHRDRFYEDRDRLRRKIDEWDDDCRNYQLAPEQQRELSEAREYAGKEFPTRPLANRQLTPDEDPGLKERIRKTLIDFGVPVAFVGVMVVLVIAALADPEPFSKVVLIVGVAAAVALFALFGRQDEATTAAKPSDGNTPPAGDAAA